MTHFIIIVILNDCELSNLNWTLKITKCHHKRPLLTCQPHPQHPRMASEARGRMQPSTTHPRWSIGNHTPSMPFWASELRRRPLRSGGGLSSNDVTLFTFWLPLHTRVWVEIFCVKVKENSNVKSNHYQTRNVFFTLRKLTRNNLEFVWSITKI